MWHVQSAMHTLGELHTLCSLPSLRSFDLLGRAFFPDSDYEAEGEEGQDWEMEAARVALAAVRRALPALQHLHYAPDELFIGEDGLKLLAGLLNDGQRAGQGGGQGGGT